MAKKPVTQAGQLAALPKLHKIGEVIGFGSGTAGNNELHENKTNKNSVCNIKVDEETIEIHEDNEAFQLKWNAKRVHKGFLYIAKAWIGWKGARRYRITAHVILQDNTLWRRKTLFESKDGLEVISVASKNDILPNTVMEGL